MTCQRAPVLQYGFKLTSNQLTKTFVWHLIKKWLYILTKGCKLSKNQFGTIIVFGLFFVEKMTFAVLLNKRLCYFFL